MILNRRAHYEAAAFEAAQILLEPLHEMLPGLVNRVVQNLFEGRTFAAGGQVLLRELIAWRDSVVEKEVQSALEHQEYRLMEIRSREAQQNKTILDLQNKISGLEKDIEKQILEKESYQKTIQDQNSIVAEQHERLIALLGRAKS